MILFPVLLAAALVAPPRPATPQSAADINMCPCCHAVCAKPWVVPDRWDDTTRVVGHEDWANNGNWDSEPYDDLNANALYDAGEPFKDQNGNGVYDAEWYHPLNTGYVAWKDAGAEIVLKPGSQSGTFAAGHYNAIDMADDGRVDDTGNRYEWDIAHCNPTLFGGGDVVHFHPGDLSGPTRRGVDSLIARDPNAHWDPVTQEVISDFRISPRSVIIGMADPRRGFSTGRGYGVISKITAFFIESIDDEGNVIGRFIRVATIDGIDCPRGYPPDAAFISTCAP